MIPQNAGRGPASNRRLKSRRGGFTLIELLVVIAIMGILYSVVLPGISAARRMAKVAHAKEELIQIRTAITGLANDTNYWPKKKTINAIETSGTNEVWDLNPNTIGLVDTDGTFPGWVGPYISTVPLDPWGHNYFFDTDYKVHANDEPCPTSDDQSDCVDVAALGSFGSEGSDLSQNQYYAGEIILILAR